MPIRTQLPVPKQAYYDRVNRALDAGMTPEQALRAAKVEQPERACHVFVKLGSDIAKRLSAPFSVARYTIRGGGTHVVPIIDGKEIDATGTDSSSLTNRHVLTERQLRIYSTIQKIKEPLNVAAGKNKKAKRMITFAGMPVGIEYEVGDTKTHKDGKTSVYWYAYGFIDKTKAEDGGSVDVYLGPNQHADNVYVVSQIKKDGTYDEDKVMLGFANEQHARTAYLAQYPLSFFGGIASVPMRDFQSRYLKEFKVGEEEMTVAKSNEQAVADFIIKAAGDKVDPDKYRKEHGKCPVGYNWDGKTCVQVKDGNKDPKPAEKPSKVKKSFDKSVDKYRKLDKKMDDFADSILPKSVKDVIGDSKTRQARKVAQQDMLGRMSSHTANFVRDSIKDEAKDYKRAFSTVKKFATGKPTTLGDKLHLGMQTASAAFDIAGLVAGAATFGAGTAAEQAVKVGIKQGLKAAAKRIMTKEGSRYAAKAAAKYAAKKIGKKAAMGGMSAAWKEYSNATRDEKKGIIRKLTEKYMQNKSLDKTKKALEDKGAKFEQEDYKDLHRAKTPQASVSVIATSDDEAMELLYTDFLNTNVQEAMDEFMDLPEDEVLKHVQDSEDLDPENPELLTEQDLTESSNETQAMVLASTYEELSKRGSKVLAKEVKEGLLRKIITLDNFQKALKTLLNALSRAKREDTPGKRVLEALRVLIEDGSEELAIQVSGDDEDLRNAILDAGSLLSSIVRRFGRRYADDIFTLIAKEITKRVNL